MSSYLSYLGTYVKLFKEKKTNSIDFCNFIRILLTEDVFFVKSSFYALLIEYQHMHFKLRTAKALIL